MARTYEGHMDWEYQGTGPVDATSPFAQFVGSQNKSNNGVSSFYRIAFRGHRQANFCLAVFTTPAKNNNARPSIFQSSPSKPLPPLPPQQSFFSPRIPGGHAAPPFRNPAFTTPRKPFDDVALSEASGAETSPGMTESDFPNDTPEVDRMADANASAASPSRIDKTFRYAKNSPRRHAPGRGELPRGDVLRKRKRFLHDRDVRSVRRRQGLDYDNYDGSEFEYSESDSEAPSRGKGRGKNKRDGDGDGWIGGVFRAADSPDFPRKAIGILKVIFASVLLLVALITGYSTIITIKTDIQQANEQARAIMLNKISECTKHYQANLCVQNLPALQAQCQEWKDCMNDDPDVTFTIRNSFKELAKIINSFSGELHWKSWVFVFSFSALLLWFCIQGMGILATKTTQVYLQHHQATTPFSSQPSISANWRPIETPRTQRNYHMLEDNGSDMDDELRPPFKAALPPPQTPSGRRSPTKAERARSPSKHPRSPMKRY
jgi:hypothetical protein